MSRGARCEGCGSGAGGELGALVSPCLCGKKSEEAGRWHSACLQRHLEGVVAASGDPDLGVERVRCERCGEEFHVAVSEEAWARVWSCGALGHLLEVCMLLFVLVAFSFSFELVMAQRDEAERLEERREEAVRKHDVEALREIAQQRALRGRALGPQAIDPNVGYWLFAMFALTLLLALATVAKVLQRWRRAAAHRTLKAETATARRG